MLRSRVLIFQGAAFGYKKKGEGGFRAFWGIPDVHLLTCTIYTFSSLAWLSLLLANKKRSHVNRCIHPSISLPLQLLQKELCSYDMERGGGLSSHHMVQVPVWPRNKHLICGWEHFEAPNFLFRAKKSNSNLGVEMSNIKQEWEGQYFEVSLTAASAQLRWNSRYHICTGDLHV